MPRDVEPRSSVLFVTSVDLVSTKPLRARHASQCAAQKARPARPRVCIASIANSSEQKTAPLRMSTSTTALSPPTRESVEPDIQAESLVLLEWPQISAHVLHHASTQRGRAALCPTESGLYIGSTRTESERLLAETRELYHLEFTRGKPLSFSGVHDVSALVRLASKGKMLTGKNLISIAQTLYSARVIRKHIDAEVSAGAELPILQSLVSTFRTWPEKEREIMRFIDEFGDVVDSADPQLRGIRQSLRDAFADIRMKLNDIMAKHADAIQDRVITQRFDRFVIPVKMSRKADFRKGIVHDASSSGSTAFIEPASVRPINDRLRELGAKEKARVNAILRKLSLDVVGPIAEDVCNLVEVLAQIDAAVARARCSKALDAVDVAFDDSKPLRLIGARHPLLAWKAMADSSVGSDADRVDAEKVNSELADFSKSVGFVSQEPMWKSIVVPSSYVLEEEVRCVCVTGPNTGGKTLSLKTLGVCVLMAKAGLFVPGKTESSAVALAKENELETGVNDEPRAEVETARIPFFDLVLADIGDDQSLVQSLSTFSGHIRRIKRILTKSTSKSLVLLDEIGSGTDPAEGAALGMAILRHLAVGQKAALTFATTHHGELKTLKYGDESSARFFENASVEFDDVRMAPTFRLVWGIPGRSNALAIASRLGLIDGVIEEARLLLTGATPESGLSSRVDIEKMISGLEREKKKAEKAREEAESILRRIDGLRAEHQERLDRLTSSEKALREDQKAVMDSELTTARKKIAKVIKEMQQGGGSARAASLASQKLNRISSHGASSAASLGSNGSPDCKGVEVGDISVGDRVIVPRLGVAPVDVVEVVSGKELMVAIGSMRAKVKVKEVSGLLGPQQPVASQAFRPGIKSGESEQRKKMVVRTAANTIDIRGERVESAEGKVDQAIDKVLALGSLWIIHGHGTGRLKNGIREFLRSHHLVYRIEDAEQADGGSGVTVAYLL